MIKTSSHTVLVVFLIILFLTLLEIGGNFLSYVINGLKIKMEIKSEMPIKIESNISKSFISSNLIVVEGFDGTGKTTLCENLAKVWKQWSNNQPSYYREPGSTAISEELREFMFTHCSLDENMLSLLMTSSRYELMKTRVNPDLHLRPVILDRFVYSTLVYQGGDNSELINKIVHLHDMYIGVLPKIIIFCHAKPSDIVSRISSRDKKDSFDDKFIEKIDVMQTRFWKAIHETSLHSTVKPNIISVNTSEFESELLSNLVSGVVKDFRNVGVLAQEFELGSSFVPILS